MRPQLLTKSNLAAVRPHLLLLLLGVSAMMMVTAAEEEPGIHERRLTLEERQELLRRNKERHEGRTGCYAKSPKENKPFPTAPKSFSTKVEVSIQDKKTKVFYGEEKFDGELNSGVLKYELLEGIIADRPYDREEVIHYSKPLDEALFIKTNLECQDEGGENCDARQSCKASNLESVSDEMDHLFGFQDINHDSSYTGAAGILQWGPGWHYTYTGSNECRGMDCDIYETCITDERKETTISITYYWSNVHWTIEGSPKQVPIAIEIYAKKHGFFITREVNERFDFYNFLRDVRPSLDVLMPPAQVYCKNRKSTYEPPKLPHHSMYNSEIITGFDMPIPAGENETETVKFRGTFYQTEFYDWDLKITRMDYVPFFVIGAQRRYDDFTERIHEFNQGLTYNIKPRLKTCEVAPIQNKTSGDVSVNPDGSVSMQSPMTMMDMDEPMQYNGAHQTRGVSADVWVGRKKNPILIFFEETYVWYYADLLSLEETTFRSSTKGQKKTTYFGGVSQKEREALFQSPLRELLKKDQFEVISPDRVPLRFEKYLSLAAAGPHTIYNIYDYMSDVPTTHYHDISLCYNSSMDYAQSFVFDLPADSIKKVRKLRDNLMYAALVSLAFNGQVSPLRINRLVIEERDEEVRVLFTLLDKLPLQGDGTLVNEEKDLEVARQLIEESIDKSQLIFTVKVGYNILHPEEPNYVLITALPYTMKKVDRSQGNHYVINKKRQYSSGDMGGLAIGTLLLGILVGVGAFMILQRESWGPKNFSLPRVAMAKAGGGASNEENIVVPMATNLTVSET